MDTEQELRAAVEAYEHRYGPDDPRLAPPLRALAEVCTVHGRYTEAEGLLLRVLALLGDGTEEKPWTPNGTTP